MPWEWTHQELPATIEDPKLTETGVKIFNSVIGGPAPTETYDTGQSNGSGLFSGILGPDDSFLAPSCKEQRAHSHAEPLYGAIAAKLVSVSFGLGTVPSIKNGKLIFGRTNSTKFYFGSQPTHSPVTKRQSILEYQLARPVRYLASSYATAGIVDTRTTLILIATGTPFYNVDTFRRYRRATGAVLDPATRLLRITPTQVANFKPQPSTTGGLSSQRMRRSGPARSTSSSAERDSIYQQLHFWIVFTRFWTRRHRAGLAITPFSPAEGN
ncbi:hypothetical protein DFH94DRAFT_811553 [Russula ochroleuca]|uniref:Uncharacterized protein n=1 Tax=Russula ochroleuca TaxID=152965 RepID=A0A9P5JYW1_9AGAM|nr:hypothetical protein DFH94DRAFT_811553 [Russula ochroleuca]